MEGRLILLPDEILHLILCYVHPRESVALERTSRRFRNITNEPLLWRLYCQKLFHFWDERHEFQKKLAGPIHAVDWKTLYVTRHLIDEATSDTLDSILGSQSGRIEKFHTIISFGYDVKDTLIRHSLAGPDEDDHLARRYYSNAILGCLHRSMAIPEWAKLRNGEHVSLERALGAFDLFIPESQIGSLDEITAMLNDIVTKLVTKYPNIELLSPRAKALTVAAYLREENLTGIEPDREYHDLQHNFLGIALKDTNHNSLPLISAAIFCYVAQSIGLNARPCGFPFHVHVIIMPARGFDMDGHALPDNSRGEPMYMDPFRSANETPVSELRSQLVFLGASGLEQSTFLGESLTPEIVLRCGKNILNSIEQMSHPRIFSSTTLDAVGAKYAGLWSLMLFTGPARPVGVRQYLPWLMELFLTDFPSDIYLIERYLVPLFRGFQEYEHLLENLHVMRAVDEMPKQVRHRTSEHKNVTYRIGQVFRHRRYNYRAIITGWDAECGAGEQWMREMDIDHLRAGRHQSFYHALVEDRSVRYVAEENIEIITPSLSELPAVFLVVAGKNFKRWDEQSRSFVSNMRDEYPDD